MGGDSCGTVCFAFHDQETYVLMVQNRFSWSFPKGHREEGETETETAIRETLEETGIAVRIISSYRVCAPSARENEQRSIIFFPAESLVGMAEPTPQPNEVMAAAWVPLAQAREIIAFAPDREILAKMTEYINKQKE